MVGISEHQISFVTTLEKRVLQAAFQCFARLQVGHRLWDEGIRQMMRIVGDWVEGVGFGTLNPKS